jgi:hypothetical protein
MYHLFYVHAYPQDNVQLNLDFNKMPKIFKRNIKYFSDLKWQYC